MIKKSTVIKNKSMLFSIGVGIVGAMIVSILLTIVQANFVLNGKIKEEMTASILFFVRLLSVMIGSLLGTGLYKQKHLQIIGVTSLVYMIILVGTGIIFFDDSFKGFWGGLISVILGGLITYGIRMKLFQKPKHKVRYNR